MILLGAIPTDKIAVAVLALITAALLFNIKKYFARQTSAKKVRHKGDSDYKYMTAREMAQKNAQIKPEPTFTGTHKPEMIARWEVEFFELTRQMSAQIDTKMSALSALSQDAGRVCQRMELLLERLETTIAAQDTIAQPTTAYGFPSRQVEFREETILPSSNPRQNSRNSERSLSAAPQTPPPPHIFAETSPAVRSDAHSEKKTLFPRLASLSGLNFTDYDDLAAIGADLFAENLSSEPLKKEAAKRPTLERTPFESQALEKSFSEKKGLDKLNFTDSLSSTQSQRSPRSNYELKPHYPNAPEKQQYDQTLGELLLQEKSQDQLTKMQSAKLQSVPKTAPTLQATPIESIFKPLETHPQTSRPTPQIVPRERVIGNQ